MADELTPCVFKVEWIVCPAVWTRLVSAILVQAEFTEQLSTLAVLLWFHRGIQANHTLEGLRGFRHKLVSITRSHNSEVDRAAASCGQLTFNYSIGSNCHGTTVTVTELIALPRVTEGLIDSLLFVTEVVQTAYNN